MTDQLGRELQIAERVAYVLFAPRLPGRISRRRCPGSCDLAHQLVISDVCSFNAAYHHGSHADVFMHGILNLLVPPGQLHLVVGPLGLCNWMVMGLYRWVVSLGVGVLHVCGCWCRQKNAMCAGNISCFCMSTCVLHIDYHGCMPACAYMYVATGFQTPASSVNMVGSFLVVVSRRLGGWYAVGLVKRALCERPTVALDQIAPRLGGTIVGGYGGPFFWIAFWVFSLLNRFGPK